MDRIEPHWRINSSFSPPLPRRWDCQFHPDGLSRVTNGPVIYESSASSQSRGSRNMVSSEPLPSHYHSVSDGALSYYGSPSDNHQAPRWTPPVQRYDLGEFSTPSGGARPEASVFSRRNERRFTSRVPSVSSSLSSPSPFSESSQWASTSKPIFIPPSHFSGRRSFMSKPVYPLVYPNPVSDAEIYRSTTTPRYTFSPDLKFHKSLTQLQRMEASPDPNTSSSRREGFRWSNASSYDFGFDGDTVDITEHIGLETLSSPCTDSSMHQRCGLCEKPLWHKSPWSARRIVRSNDMPVTGVLACGHVFHAECLEETTPKSQINEPPCPVCQKTVGGGDRSISFSEPLQVTLRSVRAGSSSNANVDLSQSLPMPRRGGSMVKNQFKKRFFKGKKMGKDIFASSSSSSMIRDNNQGRQWRLRFGQSSK
ncbi:uncharacterized protein A4U43_C07F7990 [Asparagus officinalis]|uniref:RING-type domain-containing protein n=1 Tax=Asparagus officinalis TaxID=4686 RepID=A0A5P1EAJ5_ASPOF|nr:uncharacterized protein LOC109848220 [Asparagus officinalis]XP_020273210.1 uncharacterized protein LOC109848220 [Asparagus officinalis]ONK62773.1 uncharacterized protein A4U43_C07F7990 [Asparagus officinalis]